MNNDSIEATQGRKFEHLLERGVESAAAGAHGRMESASAAMHPAVDRFVTGAHQVIDSAGEVAARVARPVGRKGDQLNANGRLFVGRTRRFMRERPVMSLGIAVAAGYVLSRILSTRKD